MSPLNPGRFNAWVRLSQLLDHPLPWWPSRLRDPDAMRAWTPGSPPVATRLASTLPRRLELAARAIRAAAKSPVIDRYLEYHETDTRFLEPLPDSRWLVNAATPIIPETDRSECPDEDEIADIEVPRDASLSAAADTLLYSNTRYGCAFVISADTDNRFERALLDMPTAEADEFDRSLLALSLRPDDDMVFRRIDDSDAHIGRGDTNEVVVAPPTAIPGMGAPRLFELPGGRHPIVLDDQGRAWPFPYTPDLTGYQIGYLGAGPTGYAFAIARLRGVG